MASIDNAILDTLLYSDIFDYPLTRDELWRYLVFPKVPKSLFEKAVTGYIFWEEHEDYICIKGRGSIISLRKKRSQISKSKLLLAQKASRILSSIPSVLLIGVSGSLALSNADRDDDIDFFIITASGMFWSTRLFCLLLLHIFGMRRKYHERISPDAICINMIVSEDQMVFDQERRDLYTAREIMQLLPIFSRDKTYEHFLEANSWTKKILPNADKRNSWLFVKADKVFWSYGLLLFEPFARWSQRWFMKKHQTNEEVTDGFAAFHPHDYRHQVMREYETRGH